MKFTVIKPQPGDSPEQLAALLAVVFPTADTGNEVVTND